MNQKLKTVGTTIALTFVLGIYACSSDKPAPLPTIPAPSESQSAEISEAPTPPQITRNGSGPATIDPEPTRDEPAPDKTTDEPKPTTGATSSDAGTPANQFAARWGKRYPNVPEYAILKAANGTCRLIEKSGADWNNDELLKSSVGAALELAGMQYNDAVEFAQDAEQNYCASVSNPT